VADYAPAATYSIYGTTGFETFCIQTDVSISTTTAYNYSVSLNAIGGNYAIPLSEGTAWLYSQFAQGTLSGYDYANTGGQRQADAGELQAAIWALQGNQSLRGYVSGTTGNTFYQEAVNALGGNIDTAATTNTDFGVEVLNLTGQCGCPAQNQLVYVTPGHEGPSVPDGGSALLLLGSSLATMAWLRRKI